MRCCMYHAVFCVTPMSRDNFRLETPLSPVTSRPLMYEQQDVNLKRVSKGSYGAALARVLDRNARLPLVDLLLGVTLQRDVGRWRGVVEVHKTGDGRVMIVGYVDGGTAARLADESESVGNLFLHHEHEKRDWTAVAIPASRIVDWDYRSPHEFSEIEVD